MAGKPPYPNQPYPGAPSYSYPAQGAPYQPPPQGPPPPYTPQPVGAAGVSHTNVIIQKAPPPAPQQRGGFLSSLKREANMLAKQINKEIDYCSDKINDAIDKNYDGNLMGLFGHNNVVQLLSRTTGRSLQILMNPQGQMVLDGNGPVDPMAYNTHWTVINEGNNQVRLQNHNNYLAIINGYTTVLPVQPGIVPGMETKFQLSQTDQQFVTLESLSCRKQHVAVLQDGQLKPAIAAGKEQHSHFGVKLVSRVNPTVVHVVHK